MSIKKSLIALTTFLFILNGCSSSKEKETSDTPIETPTAEQQPAQSEEPETISEYDIFDEEYHDVQFKTNMYWIFDKDTSTGIYVSKSQRKNKNGKKVVNHKYFTYTEDDDQIVTIKYCDGKEETYIRKSDGYYLYGYDREEGLDNTTCLLSGSPGTAIDILKSLNIPFKYGCE